MSKTSAAQLALLDLPPSSPAPDRRTERRLSMTARSAKALLEELDRVQARAPEEHLLLLYEAAVRREQQPPRVSRRKRA